MTRKELSSTFLVFDVTHSLAHIYVSQAKYAHDVLVYFSMLFVKPCSTLISLRHVTDVGPLLLFF